MTGILNLKGLDFQWFLLRRKRYKILKTTLENPETLLSTSYKSTLI